MFVFRRGKEQKNNGQVNKKRGLEISCIPEFKGCSGRFFNSGTCKVEAVQFIQQQVDDIPAKNKQSCHPGDKFIEMKNAIKQYRADKPEKDRGGYRVNDASVDRYFCEKRKKKIFYKDKASHPYKAKFDNGIVRLLLEHHKKGYDGCDKRKKQSNGKGVV